MINNKKTEDELRKLISSIEGFDFSNISGNGNCDLLLMEIGDDLDEEFRLVNDLQASGKIKEVFLTSQRTEPEILLQSLRAGAKEFLPQPIKDNEVINALLKFRERNNHVGAQDTKKKKGKIINVIGSKGGIGTTTIAVNLAANLLGTEAAGNSVVLIDLNLLFGDIPVFLDVEPTFNWGEVARNISRLDSMYLMSILSKHSSGIYVLPSPTGLDGGKIATPETIERILLIMQSNFDFIVIDGGQSLNDISMKVLEMSDAVFISCILSMPCLINVKRLIETFKRLGYPLDAHVKIIASRYQKNTLISLKEAEKGLQKRIFWTIPNDFQNTMSAINQGKILLEVSHRSEIAKNFREFASRLTDQTGEQNKKKGLFGIKFAEAKT